MCFSPTASFISSTILISSGIYSITQSIKHNKHYFLFASIPFIFGIQQLIEGIIWNQLQAGHALSVHYLSLIYLLFAFFIWPFFIPLSTYFMEEKSSRKKIMKIFAIAGLLLSLILYAPLIFQIMPMATTITKNSINYVTYRSGPITTIFIISYAGIVSLPLLISSVKIARRFGILLLISIFLTLYWYVYAFTSVWCFFAALLSLYIVYGMYKLPLVK